MAGSGLEVGQNVVIVYNDPSPHNIVSLGYSSKNNQPSDWIIPGYYYPLRQFHCSATVITSSQEGCKVL